MSVFLGSVFAGVAKCWIWKFATTYSEGLGRVLHRVGVGKSKKHWQALLAVEVAALSGCNIVEGEGAGIATHLVSTLRARSMSRGIGVEAKGVGLSIDMIWVAIVVLRW